MDPVKTNIQHAPIFISLNLSSYRVSYSPPRTLAPSLPPSRKERRQ